eukprot:5212508-Amphidinium_carterae.2
MQRVVFLGDGNLVPFHLAQQRMKDVSWLNLSELDYTRGFLAPYAVDGRVPTEIEAFSRPREETT